MNVRNAVVAISLCFAAASFAKGAEVGSDTNHPKRRRFGDNYAIVGAKVTSVSDAEPSEFVPDPIGFVSQQKITHVYYGPKRLLGRTFGFKSYDEEQMPSGGNYWWIVPPLALGEDLICYLTLREDGREFSYAASQNIQLGITWPARKVEPHLKFYRRGNQSDFKSALALSRMFEELSSSRPEHLVPSLDRYARSGSTHLSWVAVSLLGRLKTDEATRAMEELGLNENEKLALPAQIVLDGILAKIAPKKWAVSPERMRMLNTWVTTRPPEGPDGRGAPSRLAAIAREGQLEHEFLLGLFKLAIQNQQYSVEDRCRFAYLIGSVKQRRKDDPLLFDTLVELFKTSKEAPVRRQLARQLALTVPMNGQRRKVLRELIGAEQDGKVREVLEGAFESGAWERG